MTCTTEHTRSELRPLVGYRLRDHDEAIAILRRTQITCGPSHEALARRMHCARTVVGYALAGVSGAGARRFFDLARALGYDVALIPRAKGKS